MTNAEARFSNSLRPRKPEGSLGRTAQDGHLDSHTAPELWGEEGDYTVLYTVTARKTPALRWAPMRAISIDQSISLLPHVKYKYTYTWNEAWCSQRS